MHPLCAGLAGRPDVLGRVEVARYLDLLVRGAGVKRTGVVRRDDGDRPDPEVPARPEDPHCDLAAVGYEQLLDPHARNHAGSGRSRSEQGHALLRQGVSAPVTTTQDGGRAGCERLDVAAVGVRSCDLERRTGTILIGPYRRTAIHFSFGDHKIPS